MNQHLLSQNQHIRMISKGIMRHWRME